MGKIRERLENLYLRFRGVEIVNCSTCPHWRYHSTMAARQRLRGRMRDDGSIEVVKDVGQILPDRVGVCMKAPLAFIPMENFGMGVRATTAMDLCAHHPGYVENMRVPSGAQFLPGVGEYAGFDRVPTFKDALSYMRPKLAPDGKTIIMDFSRMPKSQVEPMEPPKGGQ